MANFKGPFRVRIFTEDNKNIIVKFCNPSDNSEVMSFDVTPDEAKQFAATLFSLADDIERISRFGKGLSALISG